MNKFFFTILLFFFSVSCNSIYSQTNKKEVEIKFAEQSPKIDGILDDEVWKNAAFIDKFVQFAPNNGKPATEKTIVKIAYDNNAIYIGAILYDSSPDSIFKTLSKRDLGFESDADLITVQISTFNDGINSNMFMVTAAGVQSDIKGSGDNDDLNWDAVWESSVSINSEGWIAEIKIPYSALRFSKKEEQIWGFNVFRGLNRKQEWSSWNWVDNKIHGFVNQAGVLKGIKNIETPLRLSFTPYLSTYLTHDSENNDIEKGIKGGLDLKYGISESFTLDMMLIPDFSQVQTDDQILNLSAFETRYEEKRAFFTEGTELFSKGDLFYSKRIGSTPQYYDEVEGNLADNEEVINNPIETKIVNAAKITGRTKNGLGIGFFNAITLKSIADIKDTVTLTEREFKTQPLTNYNIVVFDQNLKNNSNFSFINTNKFIPDSNYISNVTATDFTLKNKKQNYLLNGVFAYSHIKNNILNAENGYKYDIEFTKNSGNFLFELQHKLIDDKFNPNDMGYLSYNNYIKNEAEIGYQILQPYRNIIEFRINFDAEYQTLYNPNEFMKLKIGMDMNTTFKSLWFWGFFFDMLPLGEYDYYESRTDGQVYEISAQTYGGTFFGSDRRKKVSFRSHLMYLKYHSIYNQANFNINFVPTWRVNDKLRFTVETFFYIQKNNIGYADEINDTIVFGKRLRKTISNTLITEFAFNNKMNLSLRARHYWSSADYDKYYMLNTDGSLDENINYFVNNDISFNVFNVDFVYTWRFAPGSDLIFVWKNSIYQEQENTNDNYWQNIENTLNQPQINTFSIKILYYLDYLYLKRKIK